MRLEGKDRKLRVDCGGFMAENLRFRIKGFKVESWDKRAPS